MGKAWQGEYKVEKGDVVKILKPNPFHGRLGVVDTAFGSAQFGVILAPTWLYSYREITVWSSHLELVATGP